MLLQTSETVDCLLSVAVLATALGIVWIMLP